MRNGMMVRMGKVWRRHSRSVGRLVIPAFQWTENSLETGSHDGQRAAVISAMRVRWMSVSWYAMVWTNRICVELARFRSAILFVRTWWRNRVLLNGLLSHFFTSLINLYYQFINCDQLITRPRSRADCPKSSNWSETESFMEATKAWIGL
jgi:hypothetical protein